MSLFLVSKPTQEGRLSPNLIASHASLPLLATGWSKPACVLITDNEGETLTTIASPSSSGGTAAADGKEIQVSSIAWHPVEKLLIIGWDNGKMTMWTMQSAAALGFDVQSGSSNSGYESIAYYALAAKAATRSDVEGSVREHGGGAVITSVWSTNGDFLLTTSAAKSVAAWVLERSSSEKSAAASDSGTVVFTVKPLWSVDADTTFTQAIHIPTIVATAAAAANQSKLEGTGADGTKAPAAAGKAGAGAAAAASAHEDEISFILFDGSDKTFMVNDEQKISVCTSHEDKLAAVLYDPQLHLLATLTASYLVDIFRLDESLAATSVTRRKLLTAPSGGGKKVAPSMAWCAPNVLAFGCGDNRIRVLDVNIDQLYNVSFPIEGEDQCITSIASLPSMAVVAVGSAQGTVAVFDFHPPSPADKSQPAALLSRTAASDPVNGWETAATHEMGAGVNRVVLNNMGDISVSGDDGKLQVLHESIRKRAWDGIAAATQISPEMVVIESVTGCQCLLKSTGKIKGLSITFPYIALWNGSKIDIYSINESTSASTLANSVPSSSTAFAIHREGIFYVKEGRIVFCNLQLMVLSQLTFNENEGVPMLVDVMGDYVAFVSTKNYLRLARINARGLTPIGAARPLNLNDALPESQRTSEQINVLAARVNAQGRRVALMTRHANHSKPDTRVWVYDSDTDKASCFDFRDRGESLEAVYWNTPEPNANTIGDLEYLLLACETRQNTPQSGATGAAVATAAAADGEEKKSKAAARLPPGQEEIRENLPDMENFAEKKAAEERRGSIAGPGGASERKHNLVTLFATARDGLIVHNSVSLKSYQICLVGLTIPDFLLSSVKIHGNPENPDDYVIEQKRLRDFDGLKSDKDVAVREALMRFSYYSTIGNMDEAYRCIKTIKDGAAWQALARLCVTSGRLDVAAVCLARMQDGVAARALREAKELYPNSKPVQIATLACSLGMIDESEEILRSCKRYDLVTDLYLACGKFEHAQRHSELLDRMHIHPVAYKYAEFMESLQNMDAAIVWYYNSKCADTDVPRIYYETNRLPELRELIMPSNSRGKRDGGAEGEGEGGETDPATSASGPADDTHATFATLFPQNTELLLWWARYSERRRNLQEALLFYHAGKSVYDIVRLLCSLNPPKIENAIELVRAEVDKMKGKFDQQVAMSAGAPENAPKDPDPVGAAYFVGKYYESKKEYANAVKYYRYAAAFRSGVRAAKSAGDDNAVLAFAASSEDVHLMLDCAAFFEKKGVYDRAVELYRKVGATQVALDMCIKGGLYDTLHEISTNLLNASADPEVFLNMSAHFQSTGQYQKAVEMLVFAKHFDEALAMCQERNVTLTDEMAESMTGEATVQTKEEKRSLNERIAQIAKDQGSWNLACKKYTQLGERVKAMEMLMRGGDVEKVIFFANHSRNAEIYTMTANFLQSQNWGSDPKLFKSIVQFYTKSKAYDNLAKFYDSCAQVQIDEHRNYTAALRILAECVQTLEKVNNGKTSGSTTADIDRFKQRAIVIRDFVKAQQMVDTIPNGEGGNEQMKEKSDQVVATCSDFVKRSRGTGPEAALVEESIRIGDVYGLLARFYFEKMKEPRNAIKVLEGMQKQGIEPQYYMEMELIGQICRANDKKVQEVITIIDASNAAEARSRRKTKT